GVPPGDRVGAGPDRAADRLRAPGRHLRADRRPGRGRPTDARPPGRRAGGRSMIPPRILHEDRGTRRIGWGWTRSAAHPPVATRPMAKTRILIVEDEHNLADTLAMNLRREGFEVLTAYDGLDGLRQA